MTLNKIVYILNNDKCKEFEIQKDKQNQTYFLIGNLSKLTENEIIRLLQNKRKLVVADNAIVDVDKIKNIKKLLNDDLLFQNFFFSKENYLKCWFHQEYFKLLKELEIFNESQLDDLVFSETFLEMGIKIKYLDNPEYLLKILDNSLYVKRFAFDKFETLKYHLLEEYQKLIEFKQIIAANIIDSAVIFFEKHQEESYVCNVLDDNLNDYAVLAAAKIGLVSCYDYSDDTNARIDSFSKKLMQIDYFRKVGWIDTVKIRQLVQKLAIDTIVLENFYSYNDLKEIKICIEYGFNYVRTKHLPQINHSDLVLPLYLKLEGWRMDLAKVQNPDFVPHQFLTFLHELKRLCEVKKLVVNLDYLKIEV